MVKWKRRFVDPIDGEAFKKRDDCIHHMVKNNHPGTPAVVDEKVEETKPKHTINQSRRGRGARGWRAKPFHCTDGRCKYQGKTMGDLEKHQKALKHTTYKKVNEEGTTVSAGTTGHIGGKTQKPDEPKKPKDTRSVVQRELEDSFEENYGRPYDVFIRITKESYALIEKEIPKGIEHHDITGNHLIYIPKGKYREFDYLMFYYDFVEIEMEIKDVVYAMSFFEAREDEGESKLISWDMAEYREMNIVSISDIGGCFVVHHTKTSDKLPVADAIKELSAFDDPSKLACVGGMWQYVYQPKDTPKTNLTAKRGKSSNISRGSGKSGGPTSMAGRVAQQTSLVHFQHGAEEDRAEMLKAAEGFFNRGSYSNAPVKSSYPREPKWHPVYGIAKGIVIIDRIIDYLKVYYPNHK